MPCRNRREQRNIPCWEEQSEMCMHRHGTGDLERQCVERLSWLLSQQNQILCEMLNCMKCMCENSRGNT